MEASSARREQDPGGNGAERAAGSGGRERGCRSGGGCKQGCRNDGGGVSRGKGRPGELQWWSSVKPNNRTDETDTEVVGF